MMGQYGANNPLAGYTAGSNAVSDMIANYNKAQQLKMLTGNMPTELQQEDLARSLANQTSQVNLNYLPKELQSQLLGQSLANQSAQMNLNALPDILKNRAAQNALNMQIAQARLAQLQAGANQPSFVSPQGKLMSDYNSAVQAYGPNSPQAQILGAQIQRATGGVMPQFQIAPGGGLQLRPQQPMGAAPSVMPQVAPEFSPQLPTSIPGGLSQGIANQVASNAGVPSMGGALMPNQPIGNVGLITSPLSKPGTTLFDPQTGQVISAPERTVATQAQQQIAAEEPISDVVQSLYGDISPVLGEGGVTGAVGQYFQQGKSLLSGASPEMQRYNVAVSNKIPFATEGIISATNLPKTNESIEMIKGALTPRTGVSPQEYKKNIATTLAQLALKDNTNRALLAGGFNVTSKGNRPSLNELTSHYEDVLDGKIVNDDTKIGNFTGMQINEYAKKHNIPAAEVVKRLQAMQQGAQ